MRAIHELKKDEEYMLWVASQISLPAAEARLTMLLPICSVKACAKYQFLDEIDGQCRSLCVRNLEPLAFMFYMKQGIVPSPLLKISVGAAY